MAHPSCETFSCASSVAMITSVFDVLGRTLMMEYLKLNSGGKMPIIGYGTWKVKDGSLEDALNEALKCGYRHIDTATVYENEHVIGKVLNEWISSEKVTRDELFIVTKLPSYAHHPEDVENTLKKSLQDLQLDYVDLYLIHAPFGVKPGENMNFSTMTPDTSTNYLQTWEVMEKQVDCGRTKAIGLSNFNSNQIQRLLDNCTIKPDNLQVELHLYLQQPELVKFCENNGITVTSYSTLGSKDGRQILGIPWSKELPEMLENEVVLHVAKKHFKTPAQVLLRFVVQRGIAVIPKSTNPGRLAENIQVLDFKLDEEDMEALREQNVGEAGRIIWFEFFPGAKDHPDYPFTKETSS